MVVVQSLHGAHALRKRSGGIEKRAKEIAQIARVFQTRAANERRRNKEKKRNADANEIYIVLGDFNIEGNA